MKGSNQFKFQGHVKGQQLWCIKKSLHKKIIMHPA